MVLYTVKTNTGTIYPQKWGTVYLKAQRIGVLYIPNKNKDIVYKKEISPCTPNRNSGTCIP